MATSSRGGAARRPLAGTTLIAASAVLLLGLSAPAGAAGCGGEYTIRGGDTLSRVAAECGSSVEALMAANPRIASASRLSIGWRLSVPADDATEVVPDGADDPAVAGLLAAIPDKDGPVTLEGTIVNGRRCALIATADGEEYGVVSPELSFVGGRAVAVEGRMVDDPSCTGPRTLLVTQLTRTEM